MATEVHFGRDDSLTVICTACDEVVATFVNPKLGRYVVKCESCGTTSELEIDFRVGPRRQLLEDAREAWE